MESDPNRQPLDREEVEAPAPLSQPPSISEFLTAKVTDSEPDATAAQVSDADDPAAGPGSSAESIEEEAPAEHLPYRFGTWSGIPAVFCTWQLPNGSECAAGFLSEEEFWNHHAVHVVNSMTPEERAALILAQQAAQNPSVIVGPDGSPLRR